MLRTEPEGLFTWSQKIWRGDRLIGRMGFGWINRGWIEFDKRRLRVVREGWIGGFLLVDDGEVIGKAARPQVFSRTTHLELEGGFVALVPRNPLANGFLLRHQGKQVGEVRPRAWWSRGLRADLPDWLSPELQLFTLWLTTFWRRRRAHA